jgi:imidazolonepropionase-like amidohydrolase
MAVIDAGQRDIEHLGNIYGGILLDCSSREEQLRREMLARYADGGIDAAIAYSFSTEFMSALIDSYSDMKARAIMSRLKEREVWQVPTLVLYRANSEGRADGEGRLSTPAAQEQARRLFAKQMALIRDMHAAGVPILAGTDKWWVRNPVTEDTIHDELELLVQAGLSPADALRAATSDVARFLDQEESTGTIDIGKMADLVILDSNPLENIRHTRTVSTVVRAGVVIQEDELKKLRRAAVHEK